MSKTSFKITAVPTFRDLQGKFARANDHLLEDRRALMRELAITARDIYREEAPEDTGEFKRGIRYRTFTSGDEVGFSISTPQPLGRFIVGGTAAHVILPRGNYPLRFEIGGTVIFARKVNHPGTQPNPFNERAAARIRQKGKRTLRRISTRYKERVTGI